MEGNLKEGVKILALACSSFNRMLDREANLFGAVVRGTSILEGVMQTKVTIDGEDATLKTIQMIRKTPHKNQLKMIMTKGLTVAGLNYFDIKQLYKETGLPVIVIIDHFPNIEEMRVALQHVNNWEKRHEVISKVETLREVLINPTEEPIYIQSIGYNEKKLDAFLRKLTIVGRIPEPSRIARLIATTETY